MPQFLDNVLQALRMNQIFSPQTKPYIDESGAFGGIPPSPMVYKNPEIFKPNVITGTYNPEVNIQANPMNRLNEIYQPETRAIDEMYNMMNQIPQRNNPGILRKIAASVAGVGGGPQAADQVLYAPYHQQMQDFGNKFGVVKEVAGQERGSNSILRQIASSILQNEIQDKRIQESIRHNQATEATTKARSDAYVAFQNFRMDPKNQDWEIVKQEGGNYLMINPKTGETKDTGIKTGTMSQVDEINLRIKGAKEVAAIPRTVYGSSTTATVTPPGAEQPTQQKQRMINNATRLINENPELANAIEFDRDTGLPVVKPVGTRLTGNFFTGGKTLTQEDINKINAAINEEKPAGSPTVSTTTRTSTSQRGGRPTGSVVEPAPKPVTNTAIPLVPIPQRKVGQIYILGNGRKGKWDGSAFDPVD